MADGGKVIIKIDGDNSGFKSSMGDLKKISVAAAKGIAVAASATATAVGAIGVAAVKSYAEYEQLVGGVETLFKKSAGIVQNYANQAFQTAGMSANQYMSTVTGFSASLLQSLGGDTKKAAEYANQAVIDMSDNANKMGTSIEAIQFAYQGFAKQNYTMLDNLKLGYGGTKTEMERLLKDAEKISGIKFNLDSFADVTKAIHIIQEEMGIAGTTAKEASTTIEGSAKMVKAAWENILTGMADPTQDLDKLFDNLINSVEIFAGNVIPVAKAAFSGVGTVIEKALTTVIENFDQILAQAKETLISFVQGITDAVPVLKPLGDILQYLIQNIEATVIAVGTAVAVYKGLLIVNSIVAAYKAAVPAIVAYTAATQASQNVSLLLASTMKPLELLFGVLTGKVKLQTVATLALAAAKKLLTGNVGLVVAAVTAAVAAIAAYVIAVNKETEAEKAHRLAVEKNQTAIKNSSKAIKERTEAMKESATAGESSINNLQRMAQELQLLADANGKVAEGDRARAQFLIGELNSALGTEYSMVDGVIQKYGELTGEIYKVIEAKRANVLASAAEETYTKAIEEQTTIQKNYTNAKREAADELAKLSQLQSVAASTQKEYDDAIAKYGDVHGDLAIRLGEAKQAVADFIAQNKDVLQSYWASEDALQHNTAAIGGYEQALAMLNSGNINGAVELLRQYTAAANDGSLGMQNMAAGTEEALGRIGQSLEGNLEQLKIALESGNEYMATSLMATIQGLVEEYTAAGGKLTDGLIIGMDIEGKAATIDLNPLLAVLEKYYPEIKNKGLEFFNQFADGIESGKPKAENAAEKGTNAAVDKLRAAAKKSGSAGTETGTAYATSLANTSGQAGDSADKIANSAIKGLESTPSRAGGLGTETGTAFATNLAGTSGQAGVSATQIVGAADSSLAAGVPLFANQGGASGAAYLAAFAPYISKAKNEGSNVADGAVSGLESKQSDFNSAGADSANEYTSGIDSKSGEANTAGGTLASKGASGAGSGAGAFKTAGLNAADGYIAGLSDPGRLQKVAAAGAKLATTASAATAAAQKSKSPAKVFIGLADDAVDGYTVGLTDNSNLRQIYGAAYDAAQMGEKGFADGQNSHSPSIDYEKLAGDAIDGAVLGAENGASAFADAMYEVAKEGEEAFEKGIKDIRGTTQETLLPGDEGYYDVREPTFKEYQSYYGLGARQYYVSQGKNREELERMESEYWEAAVDRLGWQAELFFADGWEYADMLWFAGSAYDVKQNVGTLVRSHFNEEGLMDWATLELSQDGKIYASKTVNTERFGIYDKSNEDNTAWGKILNYGIKAYEESVKTGRDIKEVAAELSGEVLDNTGNADSIITETAEKATGEIYKTHFLASEESIKTEKKWMADILGVQSEATDDMLDAEKFYYDEKARIGTERNYAEYLEKVKNAESIEEIEEIKQEYINDKAREGEEEYLEGLKKTAREERKIVNETDGFIEEMFNTQVEFTDDMLESEKKYLTEKARIQDERDKEEYLARVNSAESAEEIEEIKQEYINDKAREGEEEYLEGLKEAAEKEKKIREDLLSEAQRIEEKRLGLISSYAGDVADTFQVVTVKDGEDSYRYTKIADVESDYKKISKYEELLKKLFEKKPNLPDYVKNQLKNMKLDEGIDYVEALLRATDDELGKYYGYIENQEEASGRIANMLLTDKVTGLQSATSEHLGRIADEYYGGGISSAMQFARGFYEELKKVSPYITDYLYADVSKYIPTAGYSDVNRENFDQNKGDTYNYYLQPSDQSDRAQLAEIRKYNAYDKMRGSTTGVWKY